MIECLGCPKVFPATCNDKTAVLFDDFVRGIYNGDVLPDFEFGLLEYNAEGVVAKQK